MSPLLLKQLVILLWKSWIMRRRHWISAIFELIFPVLLALGIAAIYNTTHNRKPSANERADSSGWQSPTYYSKPNHYKIDSLFADRRQYQIFYTPVNDFTIELMAVLQNKFKGTYVTPVQTENQMIVKLINQTNYWSEADKIGIVLTGSDQSALNMKIRIRDTALISVAQVLFPQKYRPGPASDWGYDGSAKAYDSRPSGLFTIAQVAVIEAYFDLLCNQSSVDRNSTETFVTEVIAQEIPYPVYYKPPFGSGFNAMMPVSMMLITGYIVICPLIVKRITDEKVAKAKEMLTMMGMSDWVFWGSHFINFFSVMIVQSGIITLLFLYGFGNGTAIKWSSGWIFFISLLLYNANSILSSMLLTTMITRPIAAVVFSVVLFEMSYSLPIGFLDPTFKGQGYETRTSMLVLSSFLPNAALHWLLILMGNTEAYGKGLIWNNLWEQSIAYKDFTGGYVMLIQFISLFVFGILIWYVDNIWPFQFGIPKPAYFPFLPSYWFPKWCATDTVTPGDFKYDQMDKDHFECEPTNFKVGIECRHLHKKFGKKVAVRDVTLNIYRGQITVLLGHNGAGKTTTMNMITGIFPPSGGEVIVNGNNLRRQTKQARRSLALCPQENILYNELNCAQHLKLYAVLKGHPWSDVEQEVEKILEMVSLMDKRNSLSTQLSGGMKRKLCLGIAMVADSKILILDEPTSGMDPEARRHMWDTLQAIKMERTILMTTHYMEEADALGDRLAIMSEGFVKCYGSPLFLKKAFGAGYHLRLQKDDRFDRQRTLQLIRSVMSEAELKSEIHSEVIVALEGQERAKDSTKRLIALFGQLESNKQTLGIQSCGLTVTTMEDVFLRVGNEYTESKNEVTNGQPLGSQATLFQIIPKNNGMNLLCQQIWGLFLKRCHFAKRYWNMISMQIILPALFFMATLLIDSSMKEIFSHPVVDRELNMKAYGQTKGFFKSNNEKFKEIYNRVSAQQLVSTYSLDPKINPDNWTIAQSGSDLNTYIRTYLVGGQVESEELGLKLIPWYNREASHTMPSSLNILYSSVINTLFPNVSISLDNHPVPKSNDFINSVDLVKVTTIITCFLMVPLTVPFLGASYALFPVHERVTNSKLLQLMNGISSVTFWAASYVFDLINHLIATILILIVFVIFDRNKVFMGSGAIWAGLFILLYLFGMASIPLAYLVSLRMKKPSSGYAALVIVYLITGLIVVMSLGTVGMFMVPDRLSYLSFDVLIGFAHLMPVFSMSFGVQKLYKVGSYKWACAQVDPVMLDYQCDFRTKKEDVLFGCCRSKCWSEKLCYDQLNPFGWSDSGIAEEITCLLIMSVVYGLILLLVETYSSRINYWLQAFRSKPESDQVFNMFGQSTAETSQDSDVGYERRRIDEMVDKKDMNTESLVVQDLTKTFGRLIPIKAVNKLSFGVHREEVFGLLGVNGAGKTTTFRMLTGDETLSGGDAWTEGQSLMTDLKGFQTRIGYCPQFDALLDKLTARETLYLFCRLRGMPSNMISTYVSDLVAMVDLVKYVDRCTETYSGGNRRKLSLAIALCAAPPIIFLDEPTSGVDPSARRKIWSTLAHLQQRYGSAFVLTSHSMEECEALCQRVAIMVNGQFQCLGSVQHLRHKFGQGFTIIAKLRQDLTQHSDYITDLQQHLIRAIPSAQLKDVHQGLIHYHVTDTHMLWSKMLEAMEEMKNRYSLEDYAISDTTLEQIFLAFARRQR